MNPPTPTADALGVLLRLLDDETPEIRRSVSQALEAFGPDVSELLQESSAPIGAKECRILSDLLQPARRRRLQRDWIVPAGGMAGIGDDWESLESMLRLLSDFLHDGVTLRQPLTDALDLLADEAEPYATERGAEGLCRFLLTEHRLKADQRGEMDPKLLDLAAIIDGSPSNSLGLGLILMLTGRRLGIEIAGINLPGTFFCRYETDSSPALIDPAHSGKTIPSAEFNHRIRRYPREIRTLAGQPAEPGELILRVTEELATAFAVLNLTEDAELMEDLVDSLLPGG